MRSFSENCSLYHTYIGVCKHLTGVRVGATCVGRKNAELASNVILRLFVEH
jgi:hypothetical protein